MRGSVRGSRRGRRSNRIRQQCRTVLRCGVGRGHTRHDQHTGHRDEAGRQAIRGAHDRADCHDRPGFPNGRDDANWLRHTLWFKDGDRLEYKPVNLKPLTVESFEPKARTY